MEIVGRLTANAVVKTVQVDKKVVEFSLAVKGCYRSGNLRREIATFFECSYWRNEGIAQYLKKGSLIQIYGRVGVNAYLNKLGQARASLTVQVSEIKLFGGSGQGNTVQNTESQDKIELQERKEVPMEQAIVSDSAIKPSTDFDRVPGVEDDLPF